jgi:DNA-binding transcriptional LysR family regulator
VRQDQLDGLATFVCVAETRGFSAAAVRLGVTPSAVSQTIRQLEARVGAPLFSRTTRSVNLTEHGARFLERVRPAVDELAAATEEVADTAGEPAGRLRLTVPRIAHQLVLQPVLAGFLAAYPRIQVEVSVNSALVDLVGMGFDAGIRFGGLVDADMVAVRVGPVLSDCIVAAPAYLAAHGTPQHPRELLAHDCICYRFATSGQLERWRFEKDGESIVLPIGGRLVLDDVPAMQEAAIAGLGIANIMSGYADAAIADGRLVHLLAGWCPPLPPLVLYYPDRKRVSAKLRALMDFLHDKRRHA